MDHHNPAYLKWIREAFTPWLRGEVQAVRDLPEARARQLQEEADFQSTRVGALRALDEKEIDTVTKQVRSAYWTNNSRSSWALIRDDFFMDHELLTMSVLALLSAIPAWFAWTWAFWGILASGAGGVAFFAIFTLIFIFLHARIMAVAHSATPRFVYFWYATVLICSGYLSFANQWRTSVRGFATREESKLPTELHSTMSHLDMVIQHSFRWSLIFHLVGFLIFIGGALVNKAGPKEPPHATATSRLLIELLNLSVLSQAILDRDDEQESTQGLRPYVGSEERREILHRLDNFARVAEKRWGKSLRIGDHVADSAIYSIGDGIAASARKWKVVAAVGGDQLERMNEAFVSALVDASRGDWLGLASEISPRERLRIKALRAARHALALFVMVGAALVILVDPFSWLGNPTSPTVSSILLTFAAILSASIDPTIVERIGNATKISGIFSARK